MGPGFPHGSSPWAEGPRDSDLREVSCPAGRQRRWGTNKKRFIFVSGLTNGLRSTGLAYREPRRSSGGHPRPTFPHHGGGFYYVACVRIFTRHYTTLR